MQGSHFQVVLEDNGAVGFTPHVPSPVEAPMPKGGMTSCEKGVMSHHQLVSPRRTV